jgi:hypothetical protein
MGDSTKATTIGRASGVVDAVDSLPAGTTATLDAGASIDGGDGGVDGGCPDTPDGSGHVVDDGAADDGGGGSTAVDDGGSCGPVPSTVPMGGSVAQDGAVAWPADVPSAQYAYTVAATLVKDAWSAV